MLCESLFSLKSIDLTIRINETIYLQDDELVNQVEESAMLQRKYEKYLDMVIVNEDFDQTFRQVLDALEVLSHEHQWVPVNWIY